MVAANRKVNEGLQAAGAAALGSKSAQTRQRLVDAAEELFANLGYAATGLREVAAAAGVNVALVKRYFGGKEGLFEEALAGVLDFRIMVPEDRSKFGEHLVDLLTTHSTNTLPILLLSSSDPRIKEKALQMHRDKITVPLAQWLGGARREERAVKITMMCTGFVTHLRLLPMTGAGRPAMKKWLAEELQRIVDES
jgi:AcrR family transcriptional regulator